MRRSAVRLLISVACALAGAVEPGSDVAASNALFASALFLPHAHSHNDYEQKNPCLDALAAHLSSIEADVWLEDGKVMVGHDRGKWRGELETLYLKPLNNFWQRDALPGGEDGKFLFWLDLKDVNPGLRAKLDELLRVYPFTRARDARHREVEVILTGNATAKEAFAREYRAPPVTRDSNVFKEDDPAGSLDWSWYALNWKNVCQWNGEGEMTDEQREQLREVVTKVHAKGRKLRLWNHPDTLRFWQEASTAGVDRIGTDQLPKP